MIEMFGGEERPFRCLLGELRKIQVACDAGPSLVVSRLARCVQVQRQHPKAGPLELAILGLGDWRIEDVRETVFICLVAGLTAANVPNAPNVAGKVVKTWIDDRGFIGLYENAELALTLIIAGGARPEDYVIKEPGSGESAAAEGTATTSPAASGTTPPSTAPPAP